MVLDDNNHSSQLTGHALRNAHLREQSLARGAKRLRRLAHTIVKIRAETLGMTRIEFARRSGISRGTLADLELGVHTPTRRILQKFVSFCQQLASQLRTVEELRRLYAGPGDTLEEFISLIGAARLGRRGLWRLKSGIEPRNAVGVPARELSFAVGPAAAALPCRRRGFRRRGNALADGRTPATSLLWIPGSLGGILGVCAVQATPRGTCSAWACERRPFLRPARPRMRYTLAGRGRRGPHALPGDDEFLALKECSGSAMKRRGKAAPGWVRLASEQLRSKQGVARREIADLFGLSGKKPARIIKYIEEDGFFWRKRTPPVW